MLHVQQQSSRLKIISIVTMLCSAHGSMYSNRVVKLKPFRLYSYPPVPAVPLPPKRSLPILCSSYPPPCPKLRLLGTIPSM